MISNNIGDCRCEHMYADHEVRDGNWGQCWGQCDNCDCVADAPWFSSVITYKDRI